VAIGAVVYVGLLLLAGILVARELGGIDEAHLAGG